MSDTPQRQATGRHPPPEHARWKPGQSGNPKGMKPGTRSITAALRRLLAEGLDGKDLFEAMAKAGLSKALKGDHRFWQEIINRIDGKVPDRIAGEDGGAIRVVILPPGQTTDGHQDSDAGEAV